MVKILRAKEARLEVLTEAKISSAQDIGDDDDLKRYGKRKAKNPIRECLG